MPNAKGSLGINSRTVIAFLNDKLTPAQCKELQIVMNLHPKQYRKAFFLSWLAIWTGSKTNLALSKFLYLKM